MCKKSEEGKKWKRRVEIRNTKGDKNVETSGMGGKQKKGEKDYWYRCWNLDDRITDP